MNIWVRIFSTVHCESGAEEDSCEIALQLAAITNVAIYSSMESAVQAHARFGGVVLEVAATSLRGIERSETGDIYLQREENSKDDRGGSLHLSVVYGKDIRYLEVTGENGDYTTFPKGEGSGWLDALAEETQLTFYQ